MQFGWAPPLVWENGTRTEIITIGKGLVISYGSDGKKLWRMSGMTQATPSPISGKGLLFVGSGKRRRPDSVRPAPALLYSIGPTTSGP